MGITNLTELLRSLQPQLQPGALVFCTLPPGVPFNLQLALGTFKENEGVTVIVSKTIADDLGLAYAFVARQITLLVHSDLEAVGLTAAFSGALAREGIACNVVAGFYHDHIFVPERDAEKAMAVLHALSKEG